MLPRQPLDIYLDGPLTGAENMARDCYLAEKYSGTGAGALRLYDWSRPCLSVGRHQDLRTVADLEALSRFGIDAVGRPTGGGALLHKEVFTFCLVLGRTGACGERNSPRRLFTETCRILKLFLTAIGVDPASIGTSRAARSGGRKDIPAACFAGGTGFEITICGKKVVGVAQRTYRGSVLAHGSFLVRRSTPSVADLLAGLSDAERRSTADRLASASTTLSEHVEGSLETPFLQGRMIAAAAERLELKTDESGWSAADMNRLKMILESRYSHENAYFNSGSVRESWDAGTHHYEEVIVERQS